MPPLFAGSLNQLQYSADIGASFVPSGVTAADHDYVLDNGGALTLISLPGLPASADLDALQIEANYDVLFSLDVDADLSGTVFDDADVIRAHGGAYSVAFDSSASNVPVGVDCDAVARANDGRLLLSFDRTFSASGLVIRPSDVVAFNAGTFTLILDARAAGLAAAANVDGLATQAGSTNLLVSLSTGCP